MEKKKLDVNCFNSVNKCKLSCDKSSFFITISMHDHLDFCYSSTNNNKTRAIKSTRQFSRRPLVIFSVHFYTKEH